LPCFSKPRCITHLQIPHWVRQKVYLSKDFKIKVFLCFMLPRILHW
jgi:hypothetical protein